MSNNKQSSVEWLMEKIATKDSDSFIAMSFYIAFKEEFEQAKAMHKKETIDFALHCMLPKLNPDKSTLEVVSDIYDEFFGGEQ